MVTLASVSTDTPKGKGKERKEFQTHVAYCRLTIFCQSKDKFFEVYLLVMLNLIILKYELCLREFEYCVLSSLGCSNQEL